MKNLSLILNVVLLIAVGVLYYLHFSPPKVEATDSDAVVTGASGPIAYVNYDSLLEKYEFVNTIKEQLEGKTQKLEQELGNRQRGLQSEINEYNRTGGNLTPAQRNVMEENLGRKQQNLALYQQSLQQEMLNEQSKWQLELHDKVEAFLKDYGNAHGLHMIMKFDITSDVLFAGDSLDITDEVIKGLNEAYKAELAKPAAKADSTATKKK